MKRINKILVPTDFSKGSEISYQYANDLTKKFGGKVDLVHVIPSFKYLKESIKQLGLPFDMDKQIYPHLQSDAKLKLTTALDESIEQELRGETFAIINRKVDDALVDMVKDNSYDMILIGVQGSNENAFFHGTITEHVVRHSPVPVMAVPAHLPKNPIRKLVIPTDGSKTSFECLPLALSMASDLGGSIHIVHILEMYGTTLENKLKDDRRDEIEQIRELILSQIQEILDNSISLKATIQHENQSLTIQIMDESDDYKTVPLKISVQKGVSAHNEIVDFAEEHGDMIVMTTHGRSGFSHLLLGSTTETVVRYSNLPVMTFKPLKKREIKKSKKI